MGGPAFALRVIVTALRLQLALLRIEGILFVVVIGPVVYTILLVLVIQHAGRTDLAPYAVIGPAFLGAWSTAISISGNVVTEDRGAGTFELLFTAPAGAWLVFLGRVIGTSLLSLIAVVETVLVARLLGVTLELRDPTLFAVALSASLAAVAGVGLITAGTFVLARSSRLFTNVLTFPLVILSGAAFPIALLPEPAQWLSNLVALKWGADLLHAAVGSREANVAVALPMMALLTASYVLIGRGVFRVVERRVRADGSLASYE